MPEREPAVLTTDVETPRPAAPVVDRTAPSSGGAVGQAQVPADARPIQVPARSSQRAVPTVRVVGFWKRALAAAIDLAIVLPVALIVTLLASKIAGIHAPATRPHLFDIDLWIDLVLATDPALMMGLVLVAAVGMTYLLVSHIVLGQTLGMRVLKMKIIDVYGDRPSPQRCIVRCASYLAGFATLFLGFLWIGFDSEKRGLQDWIAGTYVIQT